MKKLMVVLTTLFTLCFGGMVQAGNYFIDQRGDLTETPLLFKEFADEDGKLKSSVHLGRSVVDVYTLGTLEGVLQTRKWLPEQRKSEFQHTTVSRTFVLRGSGFVIKGGYILTCAHVVEPTTANTRMQVFDERNIWSVRVLDRLIIIGINVVSAHIRWIDTDSDIALLEPVGKCSGLVPLSYELDMFGVHANNPLVATIVRIRDDEGNFTQDYTVRFGTLRSLRVKLPKDFPSYEIPWFSMNDITMDLKLIPGDSGSPIFGFKNGCPVIIGIGRAGAGHGYYYMARLDSIYMMLKAEK